MSLRDKYSKEEWQKIVEDVSNMKDFTPYEALLKEVVNEEDESYLERVNKEREVYLTSEDVKKQVVYEEGLKEMGKVIKDYGLDHSYLGGLSMPNGSIGFFDNQETIKRKLKKDAIKQIKTPKVGQKFSQNKAPMGKLLRQFPLAFEQVAFRSKYGHEKYNIDGADDDWKNFTRVKNANYDDAVIRHFCGLGEENEIEHMAASIWNQLAELQLKLENK